MVVYKILFFIFLLSLGSFLNGDTLGGPPHGKMVVCYVATWAVYRPFAGSFDIDKLDPSLCTHLIYSFAGLDESSQGIKPLDAWQDLESGKDGFNRMVRLKERYPHIKVTIAIGGWNEGSLKYSEMAKNPEKRATFIKSILLFLEKYKFDGLDLDWEYPARRDGKPYDKENYVALVKELNEAFEPHGYILTAALGAGKETMQAAYDLPRLSKYLDFIHLMCYDYHGTWDGSVGANAPLRGTDQKDVLSVEYTIKYMLSQGVSPYKMVLGLPMYGRNFILTDPATKGVVFGQTPVKSQGFQGPLTRENGFYGYNEICNELTNKSSGWKVHWDEMSSTPYIRDKDRIISYDNPRSIAIKVKTAVDYGLGGVMVWSIDTDDFLGHCDAGEDPYVDFVERYRRMAIDPIMNAIVNQLHLPDGSSREHLSKSTAYVNENGKLILRLPKRLKTNYALMRTIEEATTLAMEEKKLQDEVERIMAENEVEVDDDSSKASSAFKSSFLILSCPVLLYFSNLC